MKRFMAMWQLLEEANSAGYDIKSRSSVAKDDVIDVTVEVASPSVAVEVQKPSSAKFEGCVDNNLKGMQFEKDGEIDKAIELYEANVAAGFDGSHPYTRLAVIYRKRKDYDNEIRVLSKAIAAVNDTKKNEEFYSRLMKAKELQKKEQ